MNHCVIGILAHVDAGKTTLAEGILYTCGKLRKLGRVDHQDAFLDTGALERERGITIFSKQAVFPLGDTEVTLLDTPGHADFAAEAERVLPVLDAAILVVGGPDGVQGHTRTLWELLGRYRVPTFLFINKLDLLENARPDDGRDFVMGELKGKLGDGFADLSADGDGWMEEAAVCEEKMLDYYLENGTVPDSMLREAVGKRELFPCFFGSALKLIGVAEFLELLSRLMPRPEYPERFGARVFKVSREGGVRLTHMKITGGSLPVKAAVEGEGPDGPWKEKADQLRLYSGAKYALLDSAPAGSVVAVAGLTHTRAGEGLGFEAEGKAPELQPVLRYKVILPEGESPFSAMQKLSELAEEDPQLHISWNGALQEITLQPMGAVQLEVLERLAKDRFGLSIGFSEGGVVYKETIKAPVEGVGHFEPLRHYAEVHLLLEPAERGSGLTFKTAVSEDDLDRNWQRLILTHLLEKEHKGVLTGSPVTDMAITLVAGRAHLKHTEGGDFRQATYRAVRQGLMKAESVLLEPVYDFTLTVPAENAGRVMHDIPLMAGTLEPPEMDGETASFKGRCPVATMQGYAADVAAYSRGKGRLSLRYGGYEECHGAEEVIASFGYSPEADLENTPDSVFCSHGAGVTVGWREVEGHMHLPPYPLERDKEPEPPPKYTPPTGRMVYAGTREEDKELERIFARTYGEVKRRDFLPQNTVRQMDKGKLLEAFEETAEVLLVDGYNIIFAWDELRAEARENLDAARQALIDTLSNYQGYKQCGVIAVFDAYKVHGGKGAVERQNGVYVVYTEEAETADMYIEKVSYALGKKKRIRVATSDGLEQMIILGHGCERVSASMFYEEVQIVNERIRSIIGQNAQEGRLRRTRLSDVTGLGKE